MADANPVRVGVSTEKQEPRNTARPIRPGLVQEKTEDGTPPKDETTLRKKWRKPKPVVKPKQKRGPYTAAAAEALKDEE